MCLGMVDRSPLHTCTLGDYILTPEGDVASATHIRGSWVGLSEDHRTFSYKPMHEDHLEWQKNTFTSCMSKISKTLEL